MYGRHRNGGKGFRSNPMGMGAAASRSSPDGPVRGGFYNSDYRNFSRGFGRGQPKPFPSPQQRKGDLFMEAGRLAAVYLIAKGMLPPNALPPKFQNVVFKKEVGDVQDGDLPFESRTSALARLGSFEGGYDRKRFHNNFRTTGSKHNLRESRKTGSYNNYESDRGQENGRSGSVSGRSRASSDLEADDDALSVHLDDQLTTKDVGGDALNLDVSELPKKDEAETSKCELETQQPVTDLSSKTCMSAAGEDRQLVMTVEVDKGSDDFGNLNVEDGEMKHSKNAEEVGQHNPIKNSIMQDNQASTARATKNRNDLLQLCNFAKVPTRTRSLRSRGLKGNQSTNIEVGSTGAATSIVAIQPIDGDAIDRSLVNLSLEKTPSIEGGTSIQIPAVPDLPLDDNAADVSQINVLSDQNLDLTANKIISSDSSDQTIRDAILLDHDDVVGGSKCMGSLSFPDKSFAYGQESSKGLQGTEERGSIDDFVPEERRGEKRVLDESDRGTTYKKSKVWSPPMMAQADEYSHLSNLSTRGPTVIVRASTTNNLMMIDQESSSHISGFPALGHENSIGYVEDKQIIDSSFKICDLNLMEASDINENHDDTQMMFFSSISEMKKESLPVDGGLTISDNSNLSHKYGTLGSHGKEVEIIDLENDFADDRTFRTAEKREEAVYTGLNSFPSHARSATDGTDGSDVQDGYGLMISELLGNEIPNCSAVTGDISSLHNDMDLHNGQGMLPEDDPIYMSLGEIPISMPDI
uniref:Uncharacterized protein n=1 Tax=Kalanchoe fedtschenkoi TaxID=63787 RepID=A0A7N0VAP4_KALFE